MSDAESAFRNALRDALVRTQPLTRAEIFALKRAVQRGRVPTGPGVDLSVLYGKLNRMWVDANLSDESDNLEHDEGCPGAEGDALECTCGAWLEALHNADYMGGRRIVNVVDDLP